MDPEFAKMAMEQMSKMTPEQMAQMQAQMQNMDPSMMQAAMAQMNSMSAADKAHMREQMKNMDASQLPNMGNASMSQFQAKQNYEYQASVTLKNEGNTLHKQGRFQDAVDKYRRAHSNMAGHASPHGKELKKACALNLAAGLLKLGKNQEAVTFAGEVLAEDPANVKALYRRGQAHAALGSLDNAAKDLQMAVAASPADTAIKAKLDEVSDKLKAAGKAVPEPVDPSSLPKPKPAAAAPSMPSPPDPSQAAAMLKDPNTRQMMSNMMKNMSDDDLRNMAQMSGAPPGMSVEAMRKQYEQLEEMDEDQINQMAEMSSRAAAANPMMNMSDGDKLKKMQEMMSKDPDSMKKMMETVSNLPQEQLDAMMQASGAPPGLKMTPEMVKMSTEMMSKMSPDDLAKMAQMRAAGTSSAAGTASAGDSEKIEDITPQAQQTGAGTTAGMPQMTPDMASMAANMMSSMTPEDMQRMQQMASQMGAGGAGGGLTPEQQVKMQQEMLSNPDTIKVWMQYMPA